MNVAPGLAYEFLRVFARLEFALKGIPAYCQGNEGERAKVNWTAFEIQVSSTLGAELMTHPTWQRVLINEPPHSEVVRNGVGAFEARPLGGGAPGALLLQSVRRVRNNLFHGGKEHVERRPGHDATLVELSLEVLQAAAESDPAVRFRYYTA